MLCYKILKAIYIFFFVYLSFSILISIGNFLSSRSNSFAGFIISFSASLISVLSLSYLTHSFMKCSVVPGFLQFHIPSWSSFLHGTLLSWPFFEVLFWVMLLLLTTFHLDADSLISPAIYLFWIVSRVVPPLWRSFCADLSYCTLERVASVLSYSLETVQWCFFRAIDLQCSTIF